MVKCGRYYVIVVLFLTYACGATSDKDVDPAKCPGDACSFDSGAITDGNLGTDAPLKKDVESDDALYARKCRRNSECDDGIFCNGEEQCDPSNPAADAYGCIAATAQACQDELFCDEELDICECNVPDADKDGFAAKRCGGDDCDDEDPGRYPGNPEVCDELGHDEDCDPETYGKRDQDHDGQEDARCCNTDDEGVQHCGPDCDDTRDDVYRGNTEACDGFDNDCDGATDEGVLVTFYEDVDGDSYGSDAPNARTKQGCPGDVFEANGCEPSYKPNSDDCNDNDSAINPAAGEKCKDPDNIDEDCSGAIDDRPGGCSCQDGSTVPCAAPFGECAKGEEHCVNGVPDGVCSITPVAEECSGSPGVDRGLDEDCDGFVDEAPGASVNGGLKKTCYIDVDEDGYSPSTSGAVHFCSCPAQTTTLEPTNAGNTDCDDRLGKDYINPAGTEICSTNPDEDEDCDGLTDEAPDSGVSFTIVDRLTCYDDLDRDTYAPNGADSRDACKTCPDQTTVVKPTDLTNTDCLDSGAGANQINPGKQEVCNSVDDDCDALTDAVDDTLNEPYAATGTTYSCINGEWKITTCPDNLENCNDDLLDACETDTTTRTDCRDCDVVCGLRCGLLGCDELVSVSAYGDFTCGRRSEGRSVCWGNNTDYQLGDGSNIQRTSPVDSAVSAAAVVSAGRQHTCIIDSSDSRLYCWGDNTYKQIGRSGASDPQQTPVAVTRLTNVTHVSAGYKHTCSIREVTPAIGVVECWGTNDTGRIGTGDTTDVDEPASVLPVSGPPLDNAIDIAVGHDHSCAIIAANATDTYGSVMCWGSDQYGQLGDGSTTHPICGTYECSTRAVNVQGVEGAGTLSDAIAIEAGESYTCALRTNNTVVCWGRNDKGQIGNGQTGVSFTYPQTVSTLTNASAISSGGRHACAVQAGSAYCWGWNNYGQLGDDAVAHSTCGSDDCALTPVQVDNVSGVTSVAAGNFHSCAVTPSQTFCWGRNHFGQLGNSSTNPSDVPVAIASQP